MNDITLPVSYYFLLLLVPDEFYWCIMSNRFCYVDWMINVKIVGAKANSSSRKNRVLLRLENSFDIETD